MDTVKITRPPSGGVIDAIPSKSAAHRLLIAGFLSGLDISGYCKGLSDDITATKSCIAALNNAEVSAGGFCELDCGESASTMRFLMPLASALGIECNFSCKGRLAGRPLEPYLESLAGHGCVVEGYNPKHLRGQLTAGTFDLPGYISSQFITGLLIALPILEGDSKISVRGKIESRPYVDLTLQVLEEAGIDIKEEKSEEGSEFFIRGGQQYALPESALQNIEGDWSSAAFWIVMNAMVQEHISVRGLNPESRQGDKAIVQTIDAIQTAGEDEFDINVADTPDLVPAIAAFACARPEGSVTHITGARRLRYKETDRLSTVTETLKGLGSDIKQGEDSLTITSKGRLTGGEVRSFEDHRIAMMVAAAACIAEGPVTIKNAEAVNKSYPNFYEDYQRLGGKLQWL